MKRDVMTFTLLIVLIFGYLTFSQLSFAAESTKPMTLKTSVWFASTSWIGKQYQWWADELVKRTNGRVKIDFFWMDSLVKQQDMLPGLKMKMTDAGFMTSTYFPSNLPNFMMIDNLGNSGDDYGAVILAAQDAQENEPNLKAELEREGIVMLAQHLTGFGGIATKHSSGSFSDLKGKTIRSVGGVRNTYMKELGINPIFMPITDIYEATSRGTIDGSLVSFPLADGMKHYEVFKTFFCPDYGQLTSSGVVINRDLFLRLPKDIQKIMLDLRTDFAKYYSEAVKSDVEGIKHRWVSQHGLKLIPLTPEEKVVSAKAAERANEIFFKEQEAKGHKAVRTVWEYYLKALKKHTDERAKK